MKNKFKIVFYNFDQSLKKNVVESLKEKEDKWEFTFLSDIKKLMTLFQRNLIDCLVVADDRNERWLNAIRKHYCNVPLVVVKNCNNPLKNEIESKLFEKGRVENREGVLITHGTDTLSYALSYFRYSLKGLKANVGVTGSQIPLEGVFSPSDAVGNLRTSVFFITKLRPPHLFAVFNNGRDVFSGRLIKFRKWDTEAFEGRLAAKVTHQEIKILRDDWVLIPCEDQQLDKLHLLRTGGTIESSKSSTGGFVPKKDSVSILLKESLSGYFKELKSYNIFSLDSSNLSYEEWETISRKIEEIGLCKSDTKFDKEIKTIYINPLFTTKDYEKLFSLCKSGAILLGYGAGNANTIKQSDRSILEPLKSAVRKGKYVVISSQVALEPYDAEYESGRKLLESGGIPSGDLAVADAQVKLSYILGHKDTIRKMAKTNNLDFDLIVTASFLSGVTLSKIQVEELKLRLQREKKGVFSNLNFDPFVFNDFKTAIEMVIEDIKEA